MAGATDLYGNIGCWITCARPLVAANDLSLAIAGNRRKT